MTFFRKLFLTSSLLVASCAAIPVGASDSSVCGPYDVVKEVVTKNWEEASVAFGLSAWGYITEITVDAEGGYSIWEINPANGWTCLVDEGFNFTLSPIKPNV